MTTQTATTGPYGTEKVYSHTRFKPCPVPLCVRGAICSQEPVMLGRTANGEPVYSPHRTSLQCVICPTCKGRGQMRWRSTYPC